MAITETAQPLDSSTAHLNERQRMSVGNSRGDRRRVVGFRIEGKGDNELIEPDDRAFPLVALLEDDETEPGEPSELIVNVLYLLVDDPLGLVAARWLLPTDGPDEVEDVRRQRPHELVDIYEAEHGTDDPGVGLKKERDTLR